ncbi:hypothetical protein [Kitasatospora mediocidica]|uniref:hypothetical protein n=1 Tax=Kitasatospora mediocidica TaxID=58352 RepID=UPI00055B5BD3|nr:hypothetical protein [Kitasatospora mediocidica]
MSATTDLVTAAVLFGPGAVGLAVYAVATRGDSAQSAAVMRMLDESAAERAVQLTDGPEGTPPGDREPAPEAAPAPAVRLATVIDFPTARRAA